MDACRARFATFLGAVFFVGLMLAMAIAATTLTGRADAPYTHLAIQ